MATLSVHAKHVLGRACGNHDVANDIATAVANRAALPSLAQRTFRLMVASDDVATEVFAKIISGAALSDLAKRQLTQSLASADIARELSVAIGGSF